MACRRGVGVIALLAVAATSPARADEPSSQAEGYIQTGIELRRAGKEREALAFFERAYALDPTPRAGAQLALAPQATGDWVSAETGLTRALAGGGDPWIEEYRNALENALATVRAHLGWLNVETNVPQGELVVGGESRYELPLRSKLRLPTGPVDVDVSAPDRVCLGWRLCERANAEVNVVAALETTNAARPVHEAASPATVADAPHPIARSPLLASVAFVTAGVVAIAGVIAWRVYEHETGVFNDDSQCLIGTRTREEQCGNVRRTGDVALGFEIGAFAVAGVSAGLGTWWVWPSRGNSRSSAYASCGLWVGLSARCEGRF